MLGREASRPSRRRSRDLANGRSLPLVSRSLAIVLVALATALSGCEWIDSMFAQDAGEPPLPPPPVMPTPVGPDPTAALPPPTPTAPPLPPPLAPIPTDDGGAPEGAIAVVAVDAGPTESDSGLAAVPPTPVVPPTTPTTPPSSPREPTKTASSVPAVCRQYERCCRALGGGGGLLGMAAPCRNPGRMLTSPNPEATCRQALAAVRSATAILPNRPSACR